MQAVSAAPAPVVRRMAAVAKPAVAYTPYQGAWEEFTTGDEAERKRIEAMTLLNASYGVVDTRTKPTAKNDKTAQSAHSDTMRRIRSVVNDVGRNPLPEMKLRYARVLYGHVMAVDQSLTGKPCVEAIEEAITRYLANNPWDYCDEIYRHCHKPDQYAVADGPRLREAVETAALWYPGASFWGKGKESVDCGGRNKDTPAAARTV